MLDSCLQSGPHYLNRKMVNLKRRVFRELNSDEQSEVADNIRELFIRGLDPNTTKQDMIEYFSQFGKVTDGVVMLDKNQESRQFGFVSFESALAVQKCLNVQTHFLRGQDFDVLISTSPNRREPEHTQTLEDRRPSADKTRGRKTRREPS